MLVGRHVDDARTGGTTVSRFTAKRWQATWQNALQVGPNHRILLAYDRLKAYGEELEMLEGPAVIKDNALAHTSAWQNTFLGRDHHAKNAPGDKPH